MYENDGSLNLRCPDIFYRSPRPQGTDKDHVGRNADDPVLDARPEIKMSLQQTDIRLLTIFELAAWLRLDI